MPIIIKSEEEIALIREAGRAVGQVLQILAREAKPGVKGKQLDKIVRKEFAARGVEPTFLGYQGYPASVCLSMNDEVVHGIPDDRELKEGDILSIDLGATYQGVRRRRRDHRRHRTDQRRGRTPDPDDGEAPSTRGSRPPGPASRWAPSLTPYRRRSKRAGFSVVREYVGHGVGRAMHEDPQIPNFGPADRGPILQEGHGARPGADGERRRLAHRSGTTTAGP